MGWDGMKKMNEYSMLIKPWGFLDGSVVKNLPANTTDSRHWFDPWVEKVPWRRKCNPLHYSFLENPMDRGAWWFIVHGVAKSWT